MNWFDGVIIITLVLATLSGLKAGIIRGVFSLAGLGGGAFLAIRYYEALAKFVPFTAEQTSTAKIVAFVIIFAAVQLVALFVASGLRRLISLLFLSWADSLLGALFGLATGAVIWGAIVVAATRFPLFGLETAVQESRLAPLFLANFPRLLPWIPQELDAIRGFFQ